MALGSNHLTEMSTWGLRVKWPVRRVDELSSFMLPIFYKSVSLRLLRRSTRTVRDDDRRSTHSTSSTYMKAVEGLAVEIDESEFEIRLLGWSCVHRKCSRMVAYAEVRFAPRQIFFC